MKMTDLNKKHYVAPKVLQVIQDALCEAEVSHGAKETTFDFNVEEEGETADPWN